MQIIPDVIILHKDTGQDNKQQLAANGSEVANREEEVRGIGPGLIYHHSQNQHLFANLFTETMSENRNEGT
jgi:hypothetical protein